MDEQIMEETMQDKDRTEETNKEANTENSGKKPDKKKKRIRWILLILILLLLLGFGGCRAWKYYTEEKPEDDLRKELYAEIGLMPGMSEDEIQDRLNRRVQEGYFNASMNGNPKFASGRAEGNVNIENIPGNQYAFTVTVVVTGVDETKYPEAAKYLGQTVLTTGLLEPNSYLSNRKLDVNLPKGEYVCMAIFDAYEREEVAEDRTPENKGQTNMEILLSVES